MIEFEKRRRDICVLINDLLSRELIQPKIALSEEMLVYMNTFLGSEYSLRIINLGCFSQPDLGVHFCNILAKNADRTSCSYCGHKSSRIGACEVNCHISKFCVSVFATRIGLGNEEDLYKNIEFNYKKPFEGLIAEIYERLEFLRTEADTDVENESLGETNNMEVEEDEEDLEEDPVVDSVEEEPEELFEEFAKSIEKEENMEKEFLTVSEAAQYKGVTAPSIYARIKKGDLPLYDKEHNPVTEKEKGQRILLKRADIDAMKIGKRGRKPKTETNNG